MAVVFVHILLVTHMLLLVDCVDTLMLSQLGANMYSTIVVWLYTCIGCQQRSNQKLKIRFKPLWRHISHPTFVHG